MGGTGRAFVWAQRNPQLKVGNGMDEDEDEDEDDWETDEEEEEEDEVPEVEVWKTLFAEFAYIAAILRKGCSHAKSAILPRNPQLLR